MSRKRQDVANKIVLETILKDPDLASLLEPELPLLAWRNLSSVTKNIRSLMVHSKVKHFPSPNKPYAVIDGKLTLEDAFRPLEPLQVIEPDSTYNVQSIDIHPNKMKLFCTTLDLRHCHDIKFVNGMLYLDDTINIINNLDLSLDAFKMLLFYGISSVSKNKQEIVTRFKSDYVGKFQHEFETGISKATSEKPYAVVFGGLFWDHSVTHPPQTWTPEPDKTVEFIYPNAIEGGSVVKSMNLSNFEKLGRILVYAFGEIEIKELVLPDNLLIIDTEAFKNARLTKLVIPDKVEAIKDGAFKNSLLGGNEGLTLSSNLQSIGVDAFKNARLTKLVIPDEVESIEDGAFENSLLDGDEGLTLSSNLQSIGMDAFKNARLTKLVIPDKVESIKDGAFENSLLQGHEGLTLSSNLQSIGPDAFKNAQLTKLVIPNTVKSIDSAAFHNSTLRKLDLSKTKITHLPDMVFYSSLLDDDGVEQPLKLPPNLQRIGAGAFFRARLTRLVIPNTVKIIEEAAFHDSRLRELDLSKTKITNIGPAAFFHSLLDAGGDDPALLLPPQLEKISEAAFYSAKLKKINHDDKFPSTVKEIGQGAFEMSLLKKLDLSETQLETIWDQTFQESPLQVLKLPKSKLTVIGRTAFQKAKLISLRIPKNVTRIQEYAFEESPLQYLIFDEHSSLERIDMYAFKEANLREMTIPGTVQYISVSNFRKSTLLDKSTRKRLQGLSVFPLAKIH